MVVSHHILFSSCGILRTLADFHNDVICDIHHRMPASLVVSSVKARLVYYWVHHLLLLEKAVGYREEWGLSCFARLRHDARLQWSHCHTVSRLLWSYHAQLLP